jgi:hypothetical protein
VSKARSTTLPHPPSTKATASKGSAVAAEAPEIPQASQLPELSEKAPAGVMAPSRRPLSPANSADKIPAPMAAEIRRLAHDLSNALEIIIQASYLLQMTNPEAQAKRWSTMVDQGAQQAATINRKLREYIRNNMAD